MKKKNFFLQLVFTISWRKRTTKEWQSFRASKWSPSDDLCRLHYCRACRDLRNSLPGGNWTKIYYVSKHWICSNNFFPGSEESLVGCRERQAVTLKETDVEILGAICFLSIVDNSRERTENVKVNQAKFNVCIFHCIIIISQLKLKRPPKGEVNNSFLFVFLGIFSLSLDYTQNESPNKSCSSVVQDPVRVDVTWNIFRKSLNRVIPESWVY